MPIPTVPWAIFLRRNFPGIFFPRPSARAAQLQKLVKFPVCLYPAIPRRHSEILLGCCYRGYVTFQMKNCPREGSISTRTCLGRSVIPPQKVIFLLFIFQGGKAFNSERLDTHLKLSPLEVKSMCAIA